MRRNYNAKFLLRCENKMKTLPTFYLCVLAVVLIPLTGVTWEPVPPVNLSKYLPSDFADDELDIPYYFQHFHRVANAVVEKGENRGFIDIAVWRAPKDNQPYNARIMESILTLAFFYATDRPWNIYYQHPDVKVRLEAALDFWCRAQHDDGRFSEYRVGQWSLAPTAFATKFMGETLRLLHGDATLDSALMQRVRQADRKALWAVFTNDDLYRHGKSYTNQYTNAWAGALAFLDLYPDAELETLFRERLHETLDVFQSPVGYFYEKDGPDWQYNMSTHHSNLWMSWHYARTTDLRDIFLLKNKRWVEWLSYNAVLEPDGEHFILNRGIETRQRKSYFRYERIPRGGEGNLGHDEIESSVYAEDIPLLRAYGTTRERYQSDVRFAREQLQEHWPHVDKLEVGEFRAFSPYAFLHRNHYNWMPTDDEMRQAKETIPYLARDRFNHQRVDSRHPVSFTYIRKPAYYAAFNAGQILTAQQRYGLGLLWSRVGGTLLQSQTNSQVTAWGTKPAGREQVYEASTFHPEVSVDNHVITTQAGVRDLPQGVVMFQYRLGDQGQKKVTFDEKEIRVEIQHPGRFDEILPILVSDYECMVVTSRHITIPEYGGHFRIDLESENATIGWESKGFIAGKALCGITVRCQDRLTYRFCFD